MIPRALTVPNPSGTFYDTLPKRYQLKIGLTNFSNVYSFFINVMLNTYGVIYIRDTKKERSVTAAFLLLIILRFLIISSYTN